MKPLLLASLGRLFLTAALVGAWSGVAARPAYADRFTDPAAASPALTTVACQPSGKALCLGGGRYRVEAAEAGAAAAVADNFGYFGEGQDDIQLVVSYEDEGLGGEATLLAQSFASRAITLRVTDLASGQSRALELAGYGARSLALPAVARVTVTLDLTRSASASIPVTGGVVTARAANGTVFTLKIPNKALLSPQTITLTPVKSIAGLPFKPGLVAAVHLEPEGLRLFQPATLTIKPPAAVARSQETTFAYRGTGHELFLYPPALGPGLAMKLLHFSGYGVAKGTTAEQAKQQLRLPTRAEDRFSQKLQALLAKRRRTAGAKLSMAAATPPDFAQVIKDFYAKEVKPKLPILRTDCEAGKAIAQTALGWSRQVELLGYGADYAAEIAGITDAFIAGLANCYDKSHRKCVDNNDPAQVVEMLSYARQLSLLGADDRVDSSKIEKCVRFELEFEAVADGDYGDQQCIQSSEHHHVRAKVPLRMQQAGRLEIEGSAPLHYVDALVTGSCGECTISVTGRVGSVFSVQSLAADFNLVDGGKPAPPRITLIYATGLPLATKETACPGDGSPLVQEEPFFSTVYGILHAADQAGVLPGGGLLPNFSYFARDWDFVGSSSIWAEKEYDQPKTVETFVFEEDTFLLLRHTPE